jgi:EpsI family protein
VGRESSGGEGGVSQVMKSWIRFLAVVVLLASTALFLRAHTRPEILPAREALASFPRQVGSWVGQDTPLQPGVLEVLGPGDFLTRIYARTPKEPYIDLFAGYFPTQRTGNTIHSPQNCLPGAGWTPVDATRFALPRPDGSTTVVNRFVLAKGPERLLVLYWYQAHGRVVASEYWAKFYMVADAIRDNRTDGALVRIITPLASGEEVQAGQRRAVEFAQAILPTLDRYIPR